MRTAGHDQVESLVPDKKYSSKPKSGKQKNLAAGLSKAVSAILHPFAIPIYATIALLFYDPALAVMPMRIKLLFMMTIIIVALAIPALSLFLLRTINIIKDYSSERQFDKMIRLTIVALSYGICIAMVVGIMWGTIFYKFLIIAFFCSATALVFTFLLRINISIYMIPMGAVTALLTLFTIAGIGMVIVPLAVTILLSGLLASARLYLGKHNPLQVAAGFILGFAVCTAVMFFVK